MSPLTRKPSLSFAALLLLPSLVFADIIQRDGWDYDREGLRATPEKIRTVKTEGKGLSLAGWVEYDFETPKSGWYSLWLGGCPPGWPRDIFLDGKTLTRLQASTEEDTLSPAPKKAVQFKELNVFLTQGKHTLKIQRYGFPGALPTIWELRPAEDSPGDTVRIFVDGPRTAAPGETIDIRVQSSRAKATRYDLLWRNEASRETSPAASVEFPASSEPVDQTVKLTLPEAGLYSLTAEVDGQSLRPADLKAGYFLSAPTTAATKPPSQVDLQFAGIFRDGVVLQRQKPLPVWGWSKPGDEVTVTLAGQTETTTANASGRWDVVFKPVEAGPLGDLKARAGGREILCRNVLGGEVWLLSGQSNMGGPLLSSTGGVELARSADFPDVRLAQLYGSQDSEGTWRINPVGWMPAVSGGDPEALKKWNAIPFAFGTKIFDTLKVPVGVISGNRGGTYATTWASQETHDKESTFRALREAFRADDAERLPERVYLNKLAGDIAKWRKATEKASDEGKPAPVLPPFSATPALSNYPGLNYESLIEPFAPFAIRGVLWYQGESDSSMAEAYRTRFPALIQNWRDLWKQPDMPFLFVQIAYGSGARYAGEPGDFAGAELKEAQRLTLAVPDTAMAVTDDLMKPGDDVHYLDKVPVGNRLALAALATVYGKNIEYSGPLYERQEIVGSAIRLHFTHAKGLAAKDGPLGGFAIAGADKAWVWADAKIEGDTVVVSSPKVPNPVAVRYSWAESPSGGNLVNAEGLPAAVFRTDDWPFTTDGVIWEQKN